VERYGSLLLLMHWRWRLFLFLFPFLFLFLFLFLLLLLFVPRCLFVLLQPGRFRILMHRDGSRKSRWA
jgi:hypothetical protein